MVGQVYSFLEVRGLSALIKDRENLETKKSLTISKVTSIIQRKNELMETIKQLDTELLEVYSDIADINTLIEANEKAYMALSKPGVVIAVAI